MDVIEGPYRLEVPILFDGSALGGEHGVIIGGVNGVAALPELPAGWRETPRDGQLGWPLLTSPHLELPQFSARDERIRWGAPCEHPSGHSVVEAIVFRFQIETEGGQESGGRVIPALRSWFRIVRNWLSALTRQDLSSDGEPFRFFRSDAERVDLRGFGADDGPSPCATPIRRWSFASTMTCGLPWRLGERRSTKHPPSKRSPSNTCS